MNNLDFFSDGRNEFDRSTYYLGAKVKPHLLKELLLMVKYESLPHED